MSDYILHMEDGTVLCHHGVKGMKWGIRRYQNEDGTLTKAGKRIATRDAKRLADTIAKKGINHKKVEKKFNKLLEKYKGTSAGDIHLDVKKFGGEGYAMVTMGNQYFNEVLTGSKIRRSGHRAMQAEIKRRVANQ